MNVSFFFFSFSDWCFNLNFSYSKLKELQQRVGCARYYRVAFFILPNLLRRRWCRFNKRPRLLQSESKMRGRSNTNRIVDEVAQIQAQRDQQLQGQREPSTQCIRVLNCQLAISDFLGIRRVVGRVGWWWWWWRGVDDNELG